MTGTIQKRIVALEADAGRAEQNLRLVIAEGDETADEALLRMGIEPDAKGVIVVVFGVAPKRQN